MTTVRIDLPDDLSAFVNERVAQSGYESAEAYLLALLRRDRLSRLAPSTPEELDNLLREGLDSLEKQGAIEATDEWWEREIERLQSRHRKHG